MALINRIYLTRLSSCLNMTEIPEFNITRAHPSGNQSKIDARQRASGVLSQTISDTDISVKESDVL